MATPPPAQTASFCRADRLRSLVADCRGLRVVQVGLGLFGGGEGAVRFFAQRGAAVTVTDRRRADVLAPAIKRLADLDVDYRLGHNDPRLLADADLVVANPAVPRDGELLSGCSEAGVAITSAMNVFLALCPATVAAVTGSVGKSTTTAMLAAMLMQGGRRVHVGGNIGVSLLASLPDMSSEDLVVLELSSFQLDDAAFLPWSPHVAVVTNVVPNHLDRYRSFDDYAASKRKILAHQSERDVAVLNAHDPVPAGWRRDGVAAGDVVVFGARPPAETRVACACVRGGDAVLREPDGRETRLFGLADVAVPGAHNVANALAAAAAARRLDVPAPAIAAALKGFRTLEHRLEPCGECETVTFYNDSDATTPESTMAALDSFGGPVTLIAGGSSKDLDLGALIRAIARRAHVVVTIGACGPQIADGVARAARAAGRDLPVHQAASLREAVQLALDGSAPGSALVLSPGCASFDMFANFADRGRQFKEIVAGIIARRAVETGS